MAADRWDEQVGSVADEAARLLESLRHASEGEGGHGAPGDEPRASEPVTPTDTGHAPGADSGHDPVCQWCPLCRSAAVVRSLSPETLSRLSDLAAVAAGVLSDLAARPAAAAPSTEPGHSTTPPRARPVPVVDIDVSEEGPRA